MKNFYYLILSLFFAIPGLAQDSACISLKGNAIDGIFTQLLLDSKSAFAADTSQPEMGAAAWTCNAQGAPTCNIRSLFRYNLQQIPLNAVVTSAKLYLYAKTNNINGQLGNPTFGSNNTVLLQRVLTPWTTGGTGWSNQPATTTTNQKTLPQSTNTAQNYVIDIKDFVQHWVNHPDSNYGALLRMETEVYYNSMIFHSGQGPDSLKPRLEICYTIPPPPPDSDCISLKGNTIDGIFTQLLLDSKSAFAADTSQPEMGAAAWTCNAQGAPTCNIRSLFRYNLQQIPLNAVVTSAKLYLYAKTNNINGQLGNPTFGSNNTVLLQRVLTPWTTGGTGWSNQPATTTTNQKTLPQSTNTAQNYVIDIKDFVQHWVNHPDSNYGALLRMETEVYYNSMIFHSGQGPDSLKPRLEICYTMSPPVSDSCSADFVDSSFANLFAIFTPSLAHTNNKKPMQVCWYFGDGDSTCISYGDSISDYSTSHTYDSPGMYNVCVTIQYYGGCVAVKCRDIFVQGPPDPAQDSCSVNFTDSMANNNPLLHTFITNPSHSGNKKPVQICWNFGDGIDTCVYSFDSLTNYSAGHLYNSGGQYNVCVTVTYAGGCVAQYCRNITVFGAPEPEDSTRIVVKLYPNPTTGPLLAWIYTDKAVSGDIRLYDLQGNLKHILRNNINCIPGVNVFTMQIPRGKLNSGLYYVKVTLGSEVITFKVFLL